MDRRALLTGAAGAAAIGAAGSGAAATPRPRTGAARGDALAQSVTMEGPGGAAYAPAMAKIAAYAREHVRAYGLSGLTFSCTDRNGFVGLIQTGYADLERGLPVRRDHLFQIGSISKCLVAMAHHQLAAEGKLSLNDDVRKHLPDAPLPAEPPITIGQLIAHSGGLPDDAPLFPYTPDQRLWVGYKPGSAWSYSNLGYSMLGMIIEKIDGRPLAASLEQRIFRPLGMNATRGRIIAADRPLYAIGYAPVDREAPFKPGDRLMPGPWVNVTFGAGCVASTAEDMTRWIRYVIQAASGAGGPLLPDGAAAKAFTSPVIDAPGWSIPGARYGAGMAFVPVEGHTLMHHTGGMITFRSAFHADPVSGVGAFASANCGTADYRPRNVTAYACALLRAVKEKGLDPRPAPAKFDRRPAPPTAPSVKAPKEFAALAGRYESDDPWTGPITVSARADGVYIGGEKLEKQPGGWWAPKEAPDLERIWFMNFVDGRATTLSWSGIRMDRRDI